MSRCMTLSRRRLLAAGLTTLATVAAGAAAHAADRTRELQAQIDAAAKAGGVVQLDAGIWRVDTLRIRRTVVLRGVAGRTVLQSLTGAPVLDIADASDVTVEGLVFDGGDELPPGGGGGAGGTSDEAPQFQVVAVGCANISISACTFRNAMTSGLGLDGCTGRVTGNRFLDIQQAALISGRWDARYPDEGRGDAPRGVEISGNHVRGCGNNGIVLLHAAKSSEEDGSIISNNRVEQVRSSSGNGQHGNGIYVFASDNVVVANNRVTDCAYSGVRNTSSKNGQISGNVISRISDSGIFVEYAFAGVAVTGNVIDDCTLGIQLSGGDGTLGVAAVCANNIVRNINRPAINPQNSNFIGIDVVSIATLCTGNVVEDVGDNARGPGIGILVADWAASHGHSVQGNMVKAASCGIGVLLGEGAQPISITANTIAGARHSVALLAQDTYDGYSAKTLTPQGGDLLKAGADVPPLVVMAANVTLP